MWVWSSRVGGLVGVVSFCIFVMFSWSWVWVSCSADVLALASGFSVVVPGWQAGMSAFLFACGVVGGGRACPTRVFWVLGGFCSLRGLLRGGIIVFSVFYFFIVFICIDFFCDIH